ncbi:MAG: pyrimidine reductase [Anaerolineaceae bacterium]|nr:pyrimidine reductase [Anaerolineaceae bacterium]
MRKLVFTQFVSLDGVVENPAWTFPYWNDDIAAFKGEETDNSDAMLLGRITYDGMSQAWPNSDDEGAEYFNSVRKYVVSTTLKNADWNNSVIISDNIVDEIAKLKEQDGKDITVHGSAQLAQTLLENDLIDRIRLLVYPVVIGEGQKLFKDGTTATLKLVESKPIGDGGVVAMIYEPVQE